MEHGPAIEVRSATNADSEAIRKLVRDALAEYNLEFDPALTDSDLDDIETSYGGRGGIFEVLVDGSGTIVGTVALYPISEDTVELRKMYFTKGIRGRGFGRKMLERMVREAKAKGYRYVYLETAKVLKAATHLYRSFGFQETDEMHSPRCDQAFILDLSI
jgi:putative acetyltransferase